jgi:hypothetical protein
MLNSSKIICIGDTDFLFFSLDRRHTSQFLFLKLTNLNYRTLKFIVIGSGTVG